MGQFSMQLNNAANKYLKIMPTPAQLDALGLKVEYQGPLLPQF